MTDDAPARVNPLDALPKGDDRPAALAAVGRWPWPRQRHAELIDVLRSAGTQAVGYNVLFSEPSADPADDQRLATAIAAHGQIVLPVVPANMKTVLDAPLAELIAQLEHTSIRTLPDSQLGKCSAPLRELPATALAELLAQSR